MVKSQKISEKRMNNRGSKSVVCKNIIVKEQRVNGSLYKLYIRYTLMSSERNSLIKILSKHIKIYYSREK